MKKTLEIMLKQFCGIVDAIKRVPQDFGSYPDGQSYFTVHLSRDNISVCGNIVNGEAVLYKKPYYEKDVTNQAPGNFPGNSHYDLIPVWISRTEIEEARRLVAEAVHHWNIHTAADWRRGHVEHGIRGHGLEWTNFDPTPTRSNLYCRCGEEFHGAPDEKWNNV